MTPSLTQHREEPQQFFKSQMPLRSWQPTGLCSALSVAEEWPLYLLKTFPSHTHCTQQQCLVHEMPSAFCIPT